MTVSRIAAVAAVMLTTAAIPAIAQHSGAGTRHAAIGHRNAGRSAVRCDGPSRRQGNTQRDDDPAAIYPARSGLEIAAGTAAS